MVHWSIFAAQTLAYAIGFGLGRFQTLVDGDPKAKDVVKHNGSQFVMRNEHVGHANKHILPNLAFLSIFRPRAWCFTI